MSLFNNTWAQYASIFGDESTSWNLFQEYCDGFGTDSLFVVKDTTINTLVYKAINNLHGEPWFLRESTDKSKVYLYSPNLSESEFLVSDLTLQKSDTFFIGVNKSDTLVVDSVFTMDSRKHIQFNYEIEFVPGKVKFEFIEGVGSNFGLFYQGIEPYYIGQRHYLLCAYKNGILDYSNIAFNGQCNITWTGIESNESNRKLKVFPNPSKGQLTIDVEDINTKFIDVYIYNSNGLLIQTIKKTYSPVNISMDKFPSGLYFFSLHINNEVINDKFLITK